MARANEEVAEIFDTMARVLAFENENRFRALAYERAARSLRGLESDIATMAREHRLREIPGIGKDLAEMIEEYLASGHVARCESERRGLPDSLVELMTIPGLGPKTLALLNRQFRVENVADLERVLNGDRILRVPGFGGRKVESLRRGVRLWLASRSRMPLAEATERAEALLGSIRALPGVERADVAGSVRRGRDTIGDLDVLVAAGDGRRALAEISHLPGVVQVDALGSTRAALILEPCVHVDVRAVEAECYGSALLYFTGSKEHNVHLRTLAQERGLKINEYGVFEGSRRLGGRTEAELYRILGMPPIAPELREDRGEIEAALGGRLPELVERRDLRGDLHVHSTYSDGRATIAEVAEAAERLGYEYVAITDHSPSARIARGLDAGRLLRKRDELARVREQRARRRPHVLFGAEVDIRADGTLDYPDDVLAGFDFVVASVHSAFRQSRARATERLLSAIANPHVRVIGHPTGRLLGSRDPIDLDFDRIVGACARAGVALEVNGVATRLDLPDTLARMARDRGVKLAIVSDAHSVEGLEAIRFGVCQARRGWVEATDVVNTLPWPQFRRWLRRERAAAVAGGR